MQLILSAGVILVVVLWGLVAPQSLAQAFTMALDAVTRNFGWFYLWVVLGLVLMALLLAFSRYGDLKLGGEDDEPEFSLGAWFAMLFAAGMGIGLVFWGVAEPISHYTSPPPGVAPHTPEAANAAMRYTFFHWGLHPWAVYSVVGLSAPPPTRCPGMQCSACHRCSTCWPSWQRPSGWPLRWASAHCRSTAACTRCSACRWASAGSC
jgi:glycine betaine transporter